MVAEASDPPAAPLSVHPVAEGGAPGGVGDHRLSLDRRMEVVGGGVGVPRAEDRDRVERRYVQATRIHHGGDVCRRECPVEHGVVVPAAALEFGADFREDVVVGDHLLTEGGASFFIGRCRGKRIGEEALAHVEEGPAGQRILVRRFGEDRAQVVDVGDAHQLDVNLGIGCDKHLERRLHLAAEGGVRGGHRCTGVIGADLDQDEVGILARRHPGLRQEIHGTGPGHRVVERGDRARKCPVEPFPDTFDERVRPGRP